MFYWPNITIIVPAEYMRVLRFHVKQQDKGACITINALLQLDTWTTEEPAWQQS